MTRDVAGGSRPLGVHRAFELRPFFEREVLGNHIRLNGCMGTDVDTLCGDVTLEVSINRHGPRGDRRANTRSGGCLQMVPLDLDRALEQAVDHDVLAGDEFSLDDECRAAAHGLYFHSSSSFGQAERNFAAIAECRMLIAE